MAFNKSRALVLYTMDTRMHTHIDITRFLSLSVTNWNNDATSRAERSRAEQRPVDNIET